MTGLHPPSAYPLFEGNTTLDELFARDPTQLSKFDKLNIINSLRAGYRQFAEAEADKEAKGAKKVNLKALKAKPAKGEPK